MYIQELEEGSGIDEPVSAVADCGGIDAFDPKRAMVGLGARFLFYPTLLYNVLRNWIQVEFRWWDEVDQINEIEHFQRGEQVPHIVLLFRNH